MQSTPQPTGTSGRRIPGWVGWTLIVGALALLLWAWFLFGFRSEPSATGRSRVALLSYTVYTALSALIGIGAGIAVLSGARRSRVPAAIAAVAMTVTCLGAIAGFPVLLSVLASRRSSSN